MALTGELTYKGLTISNLVGMDKISILNLISFSFLGIHLSFNKFLEVFFRI